MPPSPFRLVFTTGKFHHVERDYTGTLLDSSQKENWGSQKDFNPMFMEQMRTEKDSWSRPHFRQALPQKRTFGRGWFQAPERVSLLHKYTTLNTSSFSYWDTTQTIYVDSNIPKRANEEYLHNQEYCVHQSWTAGLFVRSSNCDISISNKQTSTYTYWNNQSLRSSSRNDWTSSFKYKRIRYQNCNYAPTLNVNHKDCSHRLNKQTRFNSNRAPIIRANT